jgi:hypothetical protein
MVNARHSIDQIFFANVCEVRLILLGVVCVELKKRGCIYGDPSINMQYTVDKGCAPIAAHATPPNYLYHCRGVGVGDT